LKQELEEVLQDYGRKLYPLDAFISLRTDAAPDSIGVGGEDFSGQAYYRGEGEDIFNPVP
jgi:hypothetical protein